MSFARPSLSLAPLLFLLITLTTFAFAVPQHAHNDLPSGTLTAHLARRTTAPVHRLHIPAGAVAGMVVGIIVIVILSIIICCPCWKWRAQKRRNRNGCSVNARQGLGREVELDESQCHGNRG